MEIIRKQPGAKKTVIYGPEDQEVPWLYASRSAVH